MTTVIFSIPEKYQSTCDVQAELARWTQVRPVQCCERLWGFGSGGVGLWVYMVEIQKKHPCALACMHTWRNKDRAFA